MGKNRQKTTLILAGVIILNILLFGVYGYAFYTMKIKNEEASLVSEELNEYLSKEGTINLLKISVKDTAEERGKIGAYFVSRDDIPDFARQIESLGNMSGTDLTITGLRTDDGVLFFDISSDGTFRNVMQLVSLVESLPFKIDVTKAYMDVAEIDIPEEEGGGTRISWSGNFSIKLTGFVGK